MQTRIKIVSIVAAAVFIAGMTGGCSKSPSKEEISAEIQKAVEAKMQEATAKVQEVTEKAKAVRASAETALLRERKTYEQKASDTVKKMETQLNVYKAQTMGTMSKKRTQMKASVGELQQLSNEADAQFRALVAAKGEAWIKAKASYERTVARFNQEYQRVTSK